MPGVDIFVSIHDMLRHPRIRVLQLARKQITPDTWTATDVCSGFWRFYCNREAGAAIRLANRQEHQIDPGVMYIIPAWLHFSCVCRKPVDHSYAHAEVVGLPGPLVRTVFASPMPLDADHGNALREAVARPSGLVRTMAVAGAVHAGVQAAIEALPATARARLERACLGDERLDAVCDYIDLHLAEPLDNQRLAWIAGCTADHLGRLFRARFAQSPAAWVRERRVARAAELLLAGDDSIESIATACGFNNRYHFTRVFSEHLGRPPAAYRRDQHV